MLEVWLERILAAYVTLNSLLQRTISEKSFSFNAVCVRAVGVQFQMSKSSENAPSNAHARGNIYSVRGRFPDVCLSGRILVCVRCIRYD